MKQAVIDEKVCFVIAPIGEDGSQERYHSNAVFNKIIEPAVKSCGYKALRADHVEKPGIITHDIIKMLYESPLVVANLTNQNANVFYELALRHALEKPVILILPKGQRLPFDTAASRSIFFDIENKTSVKSCKSAIIRQIHEIEKSTENFDNPISSALDLIEARQNASFAFRDIRVALERIPDMRRDEIGKRVVNVYYDLRSVGILTKGELDELTSSAKVLDVIRTLYRQELLRSGEFILDPLANPMCGFQKDNKSAKANEESRLAC
ncbi:MAG: hypothetical protein JNJ61_08440 [Anaerolineae bacterium]|nr:hypothetical protein [Anaerolineae bacterium]